MNTLNNKPSQARIEEESLFSAALGQLINQVTHEKEVARNYGNGHLPTLTSVTLKRATVKGRPQVFAVGRLSKTIYGSVAESDYDDKDQIESNNSLKPLHDQI